MTENNTFHPVNKPAQKTAEQRLKQQSKARSKKRPVFSTGHKAKQRPLSIAENRSVIKRNFKKLLKQHRPKISPHLSKAIRITPIVPKGSMHGFALMIVIAIMSFLASWTVFAAHFVSQSAENWSNSIAREAIVQIMPVPDQDSNKALEQAQQILQSYDGIDDVRIISEAETQDLLAPWLGQEADISALPVPRLITLKLKEVNDRQLASINEKLVQKIKGVRFDKQQVWADRLVKGAHIIVVGAFFVLLLVLGAMGLTIIFASRAALAGNMHIIEILHLIGADDKFVARQFDSYFFKSGLKGGLVGGGTAVALFILLLIWIDFHWAMAEGSQMLALFGRLAVDWTVFIEVAVLIIAVALIAMSASHYTVIKRLRQIDNKSSSFFSKTR